jgi:hypothetical protein
MAEPAAPSAQGSWLSAAGIAARRRASAELRAQIRETEDWIAKLTAARREVDAELASLDAKASRLFWALRNGLP